MSMQLLSFQKLRDLINEQEYMPDLYDVTSIGPRTVQLKRENYDGMEPVIQQIASSFGMTVPGLKLLDKRLGWLCVIQLNSRSHELKLFPTITW